MRLRTRRGVEGEADFVLGVPGHGALIIEVKSGAIEVDGGLWRQNGRAMDKAPREQAHEFRRTLKDALADRGVRDVWIDIATAFPETPFFEPPSQSDLRDAVLGQRDLEYLTEALEALADNLFIAPNGWSASSWRPRRRSAPTLGSPRRELDDRTQASEFWRQNFEQTPGFYASTVARFTGARRTSLASRPTYLVLTGQMR